MRSPLPRSLPTFAFMVIIGMLVIGLIIGQPADDQPVQIGATAGSWAERFGGYVPALTVELQADRPAALRVVFIDPGGVEAANDLELLEASARPQRVTLEANHILIAPERGWRWALQARATTGGNWEPLREGDLP